MDRYRSEDQGLGTPELELSTILGIGVCTGNNLAIRYVTRHSGNDTIYCEILQNLLIFSHTPT